MESWCGFRVSGGAAAEFAAFGEQFWAGGAMNCPVYPAASKQRCVGCIHNGINVQGGNVSLFGDQFGHWRPPSLPL
jgi:hypothetical protein